MSDRLWLSSGVVPVLQGAEPRFLILRVYKYWDFPKGLVESGEEPLSAARRELLEETGLSGLDLCWGESFFETEPYRGGKVARYYVGRVDSAAVVLGVNPELGHAEHHEFRWVTESEGAALLVPRVAAVLAWAAGRVRSGGLGAGGGLGAEFAEGRHPRRRG